MAKVPSGASTGVYEALELRDGGGSTSILGGMTVLKAISNVENIIAPAVLESSLDCTQETEFDKLLIDLDGTPNKEKLGANAILSVSMAIYIAAAHIRVFY